MDVGSLYLIFAVCEEGFEIAVCGGDTIDQVFQDESESGKSEWLVSYSRAPFIEAG